MQHVHAEKIEAFYDQKMFIFNATNYIEHRQRHNVHASVATASGKLLYYSSPHNVRYAHSHIHSFRITFHSSIHENTR